MTSALSRCALADLDFLGVQGNGLLKLRWLLRGLKGIEYWASGGAYFRRSGVLGSLQRGFLGGLRVLGFFGGGGVLGALRVLGFLGGGGDAS